MRNTILTAIIAALLATTAAIADVKPFDTTGLSRAQRAVIANILASDDSDNTKNRRIAAILRRK